MLTLPGLEDFDLLGSWQRSRITFDFAAEHFGGLQECNLELGLQPCRVF